MSISFFVYGDPVPKARARHTVRRGHVHSYTPEGTATWENRIASVAVGYAPESLLDCPLILRCNFQIQPPKKLPKGRTLPDTKPDLDNLVKSVKDALEGVLYTNDSRIVEIQAQKRYAGDRPGVWVEVEEAA